MRKILIAGFAALTLAGCTAQEERAVGGGLIGAGAGAIIGGAITGDAQGALTGAAIGGASGAVLGAVTSRPGYCNYRDAYGRQYVAECPAGYR